MLTIAGGIILALVLLYLGLTVIYWSIVGLGRLLGLFNRYATLRKD